MLHELTEITANEGSVLYSLDSVHANESGVLREIFSSGIILTWTSSLDFNTSYSGKCTTVTVPYTELSTNITSSNFTINKSTPIKVEKTIDKVSNSNWRIFKILFSIYPVGSTTPAWSFDDGNTSADSSGYNTGSVTLPAGSYYIVFSAGNAFMKSISVSITIG